MRYCDEHSEDVNESSTRDVEAAELTPKQAELTLLGRSRALRRLRTSGLYLSRKKKISSTNSNRIFFDTIFQPRTLFSRRQASVSASYFWGHRVSGFQKFIPEAGQFAYVSTWRAASLNARHESNVLFSEDAQSCKRQTVLRRVIDCMGDCPRLLSELAESDSDEIRIAVAENGFANLGTMFALAADANADVRMAIAENHNAPISILQFLGEDSNPYVVARAQRTLSRLIQTDVSKSLLTRVSRTARRRALA